MKTLLHAALCLSLSVPAAHAREDILTTAASNGSFDTLVSLVVAAGLDDTLQGDGHLTVFAPTDEAFAALPEETLASLRRPENREQLASFLKLHVIGQAIRIPEHPPAHRMTEARTLLGRKVQFRRDGRRVFVDEAEVVQRGLRCTNGYVHVIDRVLLSHEPEAEEANDLAALARRAGSFTTLLAAVEAAGLSETLATDADLTLLAPTDEAFAALPAGTVEILLRPENRATLTRILKDHVLPGRFTAAELATTGTATALSGGRVAFSFRAGQLEASGSRLVQNDLEASNGLIHVIDKVLLLDAPDSTAAASEDTEWPEVLEIRATAREPVVRDGVRAGRIVIRCTGGGSVKLTGVETHQLETNISGGGSVSLVGRAANHDAFVAGGAQLDALHLETHTTKMQVNGGGNASVLAKEELSFSANSGAKVRYVDTGAKVTSKTNRYATVEAVPAK